MRVRFVKEERRKPTHTEARVRRVHSLDLVDQKLNDIIYGDLTHEEAMARLAIVQTALDRMAADLVEAANHNEAMHEALLRVRDYFGDGPHLYRARALLSRVNKAVGR